MVLSKVLGMMLPSGGSNSGLFRSRVFGISGIFVSGSSKSWTQGQGFFPRLSLFVAACLLLLRALPSSAAVTPPCSVLPGESRQPVACLFTVAVPSGAAIGVLSDAALQTALQTDALEFRFYSQIPNDAAAVYFKVVRHLRGVPREIGSMSYLSFIASRNNISVNYETWFNSLMTGLHQTGAFAGRNVSLMGGAAGLLAFHLTVKALLRVLGVRGSSDAVQREAVLQSRFQRFLNSSVARLQSSALAREVMGLVSRLRQQVQSNILVRMAVIGAAAPVGVTVARTTTSWLNDHLFPSLQLAGWLRTFLGGLETCLGADALCGELHRVGALSGWDRESLTDEQMAQAIRLTNLASQISSDESAAPRTGPTREVVPFANWDLLVRSVAAFFRPACSNPDDASTCNTGLTSGTIGFYVTETPTSVRFRRAGDRYRQ